jgi:hypothetical protein
VTRFFLKFDYLDGEAFEQIFRVRERRTPQLMAGLPAFRLVTRSPPAGVLSSSDSKTQSPGTDFSGRSTQSTGSRSA